MALATNALTTVATVEDRLGIASSTETARLEGMINAASAAAESYTSRSFHRDTAVEEKVTGTDGPFMFVKKMPLNSISSIAYLDVVLASSEYEIRDGEGEQGIIYAVHGTWRRGSIHHNDTSRTIATGYERLSYTVTYDGGWYTPKQEDDAEGTRDLPYDIEEAVIAMVSFLRRSMGRNPAVRSESMFESSVTYFGAQGPRGGAAGSGWLTTQVPMAAAMLGPYRQIALR